MQQIQVKALPPPDAKTQEFVERRRAAHQAGTAGMETDWLVQAVIFDWRRDRRAPMEPSKSAMEPGWMFRRQAD